MGDGTVHHALSSTISTHQPMSYSHIALALAHVKNENELNEPYSYSIYAYFNLYYLIRVDLLPMPM